ncbi:MAG: pirin family protein [Candidatus Contendobacter sp.]|nr:pirin family protein [Candidatus Contendobacter sp.]MDG4558926.1 pirin family protein [Candidatus Contendobacter sp.]
MNAIQHLLSPKTSDVGFPVQRLLPAAEVQSVGPFVFFDHMGPARFEREGTAGDVRPHPHIGLATVTFLYSGAMVHRDSLGCVQRIEPGAVNLMTAGRGIVHSERVPADIRADQAAVQGIQIWLALPADREEMEPAFHHYPADALPAIAFRGVSLQLLIGATFGLRSPVVTHSPTFQADVKLTEGGMLPLPPDYPERGVYLVEGQLTVEGEPLAAGQLAVLAPGRTVRLQARTRARLMLLGGAPLDGKRFVYWNFVARTRERIEQAKADWAEGRFAPIPGETEFIPAPWR